MSKNSNPALANKSSAELEGAPEKPHINLKVKVSQMNKTLYKTKINADKIEKLEKGALRGEGAEVPEAKIAQKKKQKADLLTLILKSEHKATLNGTQILKLPKLPFGRHLSYNEDPMFKDRHFLEGGKALLNPEKNKELEEITRKFRLYEKKFKSNKKNRLSSARNMFSDLAFFDVYDMGPGRLICNKDQEVIESYDKDKDKYKEVLPRSIVATFKDLDADELENKYFPRRIMNPTQEKDLISRLLPNKETKDTNLSQFYSTKYSTLFENFEPQTTKLNFRRSSMS